MKPKALIITGYGINCEEETAYIYRKAGAEAQILHVNDLIENPTPLADAQILTIPGGFSYGDDTGSGNAFANKLRNNLGDELIKFAQEDKLILGICNGFQILANLGLVPAVDKKYGDRQIAITHNPSTRYEDRWVHLKRSTDQCVWLKDIEILHAPIAHGEGNFFADDDTLKKLKSNGQIAWRYVNEDGSPANNKFPINPNGSLEDIAGVCDESGRILGMMPHPERFLSFTNEEGWELKKEKLIREGKDLPEEGAGIKLFSNAVDYFK
jgi:phosphoribosylformylglycinamidine synthase subunit PurQ / glutaminase